MFTSRTVGLLVRRQPLSIAVRYLSESPFDRLTIKEEGASPRKQLVFGRELELMENLNTNIKQVRQSWVDNFENTDPQDKRGLISLHPEIFASFPRPDIIEENFQWQKNYRKVRWTELLHRVELRGKGPRPWPQKGTGRARHKDKRSPIWLEGGWSHPPKLKTGFFMLSFSKRIRGLQSTLAAKLAQNDLVIVDTLNNFPYEDPKDLSNFVSEKGWGASVLISDVGDLFPEKLSLAAEPIPHINLMPFYGLNVYSMLKHETLVLTVRALEEMESKLLFHMRRTDLRQVNKKVRPPDIGYERDPIINLPV